MARRIGVSVLFFASLEEALGLHGLDLKIHASGRREDLMTALAEELGSVCIEPLLADNVSLAVNQTLAQGCITLREGDEVAFLPPITGG